MTNEYKNHGITADTPKNIMLGAGTIHKGLKYDSASKAWNLAESIIGATSGGNKLTITPELADVDVDGAMVKTKGLTFKQGGTASLEVNFIELTSDLIKTAVIGAVAATSEVEGFDLIESKASVAEGDYFDNIAFVGKKTDGTNIIVILDNALCTSGLELEGKKKDATVIKATFECTAEIGTNDLDKLPYHIYYPKAKTN